MASTGLLVEDERELRELARSYLERAGLTVLSTGSGAEAISLAASATPDLMIVQTMLGGGYRLASPVMTKSSSA
jgi:DNA-binding response OmpR family regulator